MRLSVRMAVWVALIAVGLMPLDASAEYIRSVQFPLQGAYRFSDDFNTDRSGGARDHEGIDIIADKMTPAVSAIDGRVKWYTESEASWGWAVTLEDAEGYTYHYLHLNNDTPGTDDGAGGRSYAIAPEIRRGAPVTRGQLVGWVGDSGNAEGTVSHLHFEMRMPEGAALNPYASLMAASRDGRYDPASELAAAASIDVDMGLEVGGTSCPARLVRSISNNSVYFCGVNGRRYAFPEQKTYGTWYADFSGVVRIADEELAAIPFGGSVTYRPGARLVKITTDPKVYAVARGRVLRHVSSPEIAVALYGTNWAKQVYDLPDAFFANYEIGDPILSAN